MAKFSAESKSGDIFEKKNTPYGGSVRFFKMAAIFARNFGISYNIFIESTQINLKSKLKRLYS